MKGHRHPYRREQILRTAVELFHRHGVAQTSMDAIAGAVGIRTPSIYHHFRDKRALLDAAIDRAQADLTARLARVQTEAAPAERLEILVDTLVDHVVDDLALAAVGRHDRPHASSPARRRAEKGDGLLLAAIVSALADARPLEPTAMQSARARALLGVIWSVTHFEQDLARAALRAYLQTAGRAVVRTQPPISRAERRPRSSRGAVGAPRAASGSRTRPH